MSAASTSFKACGSAQGRRKNGVWPLRMYSSALCCGIPGLQNGAREELVRERRELAIRRRARSLERISPLDPHASPLARGHLEGMRHERGVAGPDERGETLPGLDHVLAEEVVSAE